jgi:hypothetical protein
VKPGDQASVERIRYDAKTAGLVGRRVLEVRYWDVHHFGGRMREWDYGDWHHAVMGVELQTDRGPACVLCTSTFFPYGVEVFRTPMSGHIIAGDEGPGSWDASESDRWRGRLSSPVADIRTSWERFSIGPGYVRDVRAAEPCEVDVPVALRVDFAAGSAWMVAALPQAPEMREAFVPGDEIMIIFTAERMRQIGFPDSEFLTASPS